jgi:hypothetical protein
VKKEEEEKETASTYFVDVLKLLNILH